MRTCPALDYTTAIYELSGLLLWNNPEITCNILGQSEMPILVTLENLMQLVCDCNIRGPHCWLAQVATAAEIR